MQSDVRLWTSKAGGVSGFKYPNLMRELQKNYKVVKQCKTWSILHPAASGMSPESARNFIGAICQ